MYIRDAKNREEVWLLDRLDEFGFEDPAFRSRDYVLAIDEDTGAKTGFGRLRVHSLPEEKRCELTCIGVLPDWRGQGIGAHVVERLVEMARDQGFDRVAAFTAETGYCAQFGFERVATESLPEKLQERLQRVHETDPDAVPMGLAVADFEMPPRLRRRFHDEVDEEEHPGERPEDFGIDPETASYKYDTGER
ncbi:MAG: GNAT family N-acetyltransferase [Halodesulfurarchaeum sp.]